jgi:uncharacterized repeat protein (TIGR02543 family)
MKTCKTLAVSGLTFVLLTLALAGCEQITSGDFKGPITGSGTSHLEVRPTGLHEEVLSNTSIKLTWTEVDGAKGYNIYRSETIDEDNWTIDEKTVYKTSEANEFTDTGLDSSKLYYYIVKATNSVNVESAGQDNPLEVRIGTEAAPAIEQSTNFITLKWMPHSGVTFQEIQRRRYRTDDEFYDNGVLVEPDKSSTTGWTVVGSMWTEQEKTPITGQSKFTDYFTEKGVVYEYRIMSGYWDLDKGNSGDLTEFIYSKYTITVIGKADDHTPRVDGGSSEVSYNGITGTLSFDPPLPLPKSHAAGRAVIILKFSNDLVGSEIIFNKETHEVDLRTIDFAHYFNTNAELWVDYMVAYEQNDINSDTHIVCYPYFMYELTGNWNGIEIPKGQMEEQPVPVENARLISQTDSSITIGWDHVGGVQGYYIYRDTVSNGSFNEKVADVPSPAITYTHHGLTPDTQYYYKVSAYNSVGEGWKSAVVSAKTNAVGVTLPSAPQNLIISDATQDSITLSWNSVTGAAGYYVYRNDSKITPVGISEITYHDTGLNPNTPYTYKVVPYNSYGEGPGAEVSVWTLPAENTGGTLAAPTGIKATPQYDGSVKVEWNSVYGATGYEIHFATSQNGNYYYFDPDWTTDTVYIDWEVSPGDTWYYKALAYNDSTTSPLSEDYAFATALGATPVELSYLSLTSPPNKTTYTTGEAFTTTGLVVTAYYSDGSTETVTSSSALTYNGYAIYEGDLSITAGSGNKTVTVSYGDRTTSFSITVEAAVVTCAVTFNADGGYPTPESRTVSSGDTLGWLPEIPVRNGYAFGGWFSQQNGGGTQYTEYYPAITGNITLYAKWTANAALAAPTGVTATAQPDGTIKIEWNPVYGATGYEVFYSDTPYGEYYSFNSGWFDESVFTNWGLSSGDTWYYKVLAYDDFAISPLSDYAYATAIEAIPGGDYPYNVITLPERNGNYYLSPGHPEMWFEFHVSSQGSYHSLYGSDSDNSSFGADIVVDVYDSGMNLIYQVDIGVNSIDATWNEGWYYVKVTPYADSSSNTGAFALYLY